MTPPLLGLRQAPVPPRWRGRLSHRLATLTDVTGAEDTDRVLAAADAAGAPLSGLARVLMHHEASLDVTLPCWAVDKVVCAAQRWNVTVEVAAAWLLAEGTARLIATAEADRLDQLTNNMPGLAINPEHEHDSRQLQVPTPGTELLVALGWLSKRTDARLRDVAAVGLIWGLTRLHDTDDGHDCTTTADTEAANQPDIGDSAVNAHEAAVLAEAPIGLLALSMLAPRVIIDLELPEFVDDWLVCIAGRWNTTESTAAAWLVAEGAAYLYALEHNGRTDWRTGATRWVIPTEVPKGPRRLIEVCGESLQTTVAYLASRCGDDQTGIITLTVAVGASLWLNDHGCTCGQQHTSEAGSIGLFAEPDGLSCAPLRAGWNRLRWLLRPWRRNSAG